MSKPIEEIDRYMRSRQNLLRDLNASHPPVHPKLLCYIKKRLSTRLKLNLLAVSREAINESLKLLCSNSTFSFNDPSGVALVIAYIGVVAVEREVDRLS